MRHCLTDRILNKTSHHMAEQNKETVEQEVDAQAAEATAKTEKSDKKDKNSSLKKEIEELKAQLAESEEKAAKEHDTYIRLFAEFDNFRKRSAQEKLDLVSVASRDTIIGLLPVLDDCERALKVLADSNDSDAAKEGTELIYNKLMGYLKSKGVAVIEAMGKDFDTDLHEAVAQFPVPEEDKKGKVYDVIQTGYTLNGKVIRFAKVVVGI